MSPSSALSSEPLTSPSRSASPQPASPSTSRPVSIATTTARAAGLESATDSSELTEEDEEDSDSDVQKRPRGKGRRATKSRSTSSKRGQKRGVVPGPMWDWVPKKYDEGAEDEDAEQGEIEKEPPPLLTNGTSNHHSPAHTTPDSPVMEPLASDTVEADYDVPVVAPPAFSPHIRTEDILSDPGTPPSPSGSDVALDEDPGEEDGVDAGPGLADAEEKPTNDFIDGLNDSDPEVTSEEESEENSNEGSEEEEEEKKEDEEAADSDEGGSEVEVPEVAVYVEDEKPAPVEPRHSRQLMQADPVEADEAEAEPEPDVEMEDVEDHPAAEADEEEEEEEDEDEEPEAESDLQPPQRAEALDILGGLEIKFAHLRERLYVDKMEEVAAEEDSYLGDRHPEVLFLMKTLDERKEQRLRLAKRKRDMEEAWAKQKRVQDERAVWNWWAVRKDELRDEMVAEVNSKRRKLEREKRTLDNRANVRRTYPIARELPDDVPRSIKQVIKYYRTPAHLSHSLPDDTAPHPPHVDSTYSRPVLPQTSSQEIASDIDIINASRRALAQRNAYFQQQQHVAHQQQLQAQQPQHNSYGGHPAHSAHVEYTAPPFPGVGGEYGVIDGSGYSNMPPPPNPREVSQSQQQQLQMQQQQQQQVAHYSTPSNHHPVASRPFMNVPHSHPSQSQNRASSSNQHQHIMQSSSSSQIGGPSHSQKIKRSPSPVLQLRPKDQIMMDIWEEKPRKEKDVSRKGYGSFSTNQELDIQHDRHSSRVMTSASSSSSQMQPLPLPPPQQRHYQSTAMTDTLSMRTVTSYPREPPPPTPSTNNSDRPEPIPFAFSHIHYSTWDAESGSASQSQGAGPSRASPRPSSRHNNNHTPHPSSNLPSVLNSPAAAGEYPPPPPPPPLSSSASKSTSSSVFNRPPPPPSQPLPPPPPPPSSNGAFIVPNTVNPKSLSTLTVMESASSSTSSSNNRTVTTFLTPVPPGMGGREHVLPSPQTGTSVG